MESLWSSKKWTVRIELNVINTMSALTVPKPMCMASKNPLSTTQKIIKATKEKAKRTAMSRFTIEGLRHSH